MKKKIQDLKDTQDLYEYQESQFKIKKKKLYQITIRKYKNQNYDLRKPTYKGSVKEPPHVERPEFW